MKKQPKRARTSIILVADGYHINYNRDDGYSAIIDAPYFSAQCLGYYATQSEAQAAIDAYNYDQLLLTYGSPEAGAAQAEIAADRSNGRGVVCFTCGGAGECPDCDPIITCDATGCIQDAKHRLPADDGDIYLCCYHYEEDGYCCDCSDDDYGDAMAESAQGTYNGLTA